MAADHGPAIAPCWHRRHLGATPASARRARQPRPGDPQTTTLPDRLETATSTAEVMARSAATATNGHGLSASAQEVPVPEVRHTRPGPPRLIHARYATARPIPAGTAAADRFRSAGRRAPTRVRTAASRT